MQCSFDDSIACQISQPILPAACPQEAEQLAIDDEQQLDRQQQLAVWVRETELREQAERAQQEREAGLRAEQTLKLQLQTDHRLETRQGAMDVLLQSGCSDTSDEGAPTVTRCLLLQHTHRLFRHIQQTP